MGYTNGGRFNLDLVWTKLRSWGALQIGEQLQSNWVKCQICYKTLGGWGLYSLFSVNSKEKEIDKNNNNNKIPFLYMYVWQWELIMALVLWSTPTSLESD